MAHDSRCENANTSPADCDCECGGSKHGLGFAEEQVHDLETDIGDFRRLNALTPDEYFGQNAEGEGLMAHAHAELKERIKHQEMLGHHDEVEKLQRDKERLEKIGGVRGKNWDEGFYTSGTNWEERPTDSGRHNVLRVTAKGENFDIPVKDASIDEVMSSEAESVFVFEDDIVVDYGIKDGTSYEARVVPATGEWRVFTTPKEDMNPDTYPESIVDAEDILWKRDLD
jgi:hypothetical protein